MQDEYSEQVKISHLVQQAEELGKHTVNPTDLHFSPFLHKGTAATHQMREKIINKAPLAS